MATKDAYTRGKSGYSKQDEKEAKDASARDYRISGKSPMPQYEREHRRDKGVPTNYLNNTKTPAGREVNRKNNVFTRNEDAELKATRPGQSRKWTE